MDAIISGNTLEHLDIGRRLVCESCGFELAVVSPCECESGAPELLCCGAALVSSAIETNDE